MQSRPSAKGLNGHFSDLLPILPRALTEEFVKNRVLEWLGKRDYVLLNVATLSEHGYDIRAKRSTSNNYYVVEAKGEPLNPKARNGYLLNALGELVTRATKIAHCKYALGLPSSFEDLVKRRIPANAARRLSLEVLLVDEDGAVKQISAKALASH